MQNKRLLISLIVAIILIGLLGLVLLADENNPITRIVQTQPSPTPTAVQQTTPTPTPAGTDTTPTPTPTPQDERDWETYTSQQMDFSIRHPEDVRVETQERGQIAFIKWGPTQRPNTEFFDGISLQFREGSLGGQSLQAYVQQQVQEARNEPVTESVSDIRQVRLAGRTGYQYDVTSLGERTITYLPKGNGEFLRITNATVDPTNQGFEQTVDRMLASLKIL